MSMENIVTQLQSVITGDADLTAWVYEWFNTEFTVLDGYREIDTIHAAEYPVLLLRVGDGRATEETGNSFMRVEGDVFAEILWIEDDATDAATQYKRLPDLMARAIMRNPILNDAANGAWMAEWRAGDPRLHPVQGMGFRIAIDFIIEVTP